MTRDIETLTEILRWELFFGALFITLFVVAYMFAPWWSTPLGRVLMFMTASFALAMDVTMLFQFWHPEDILWYFWIEAIIFGLIALSTLMLLVFMLRMNFVRVRKPFERGTVEDDHSSEQDL